MSRPTATEETPCNLCGRRDYDVIGRRDRDGHPLRTVMCRACGLVWMNPRPSVEAMARYYGAEYRSDYKGDAQPSLRKLLRGLAGAHERRRGLRSVLRPADRLRAAAAPRPCLLDVGCGAGEFVYLMQRDGFDASGVEPGRDYAGFARDVLRVPIQTATVDEASVGPGTLDFVTMFHCLEHVPDPRGLLAIARGWLRVGGVAIVEVPNIDATVQAPAHRFHFAHLHSFSGATLAALAETAGLHVVGAYYSPDGGNVTCIARRQSDAAVPAQVRAVPGPRLVEAAGRTRSILQSHTTLWHYLSWTPYARALSRLGRRLRESRALRGLETPEDLLKWAEETQFWGLPKS